MQLLIFLFLPWFLFTPAPETGISNGNGLGNRIALSFVDSGTFVPTGDQLSAANSAGIDLLEISDPAEIGHHAAEPFYFLLDGGVRYPTTHQLRSEKNELTGQLLENYRTVSDRYPGKIAAFSLFRFPADQSPDFHPIASEIADSIQQHIGIPLYYQSSFPIISDIPQGFNFASGRIPGGSELPPVSSQVIYFTPSDHDDVSLITLQEILNKTLVSDESIVIIPAAWFFEITERQPDLSLIFSDYLDGKEVMFPLPEEPASLPPLNWSIVLLFAIWAAFFIQYRYQPVCLSVTMRYLFNHTFFIADVMQGRFRNMSAGLIMLGHHAVMTGLFLFTAAGFILSDSGLRVLSSHFPRIIFSGFELLSLFVIGILFSLLVKLCSLSWIYILNKQIKNFSQVVNLYCWPLALNLPVVTLLVYLVVLDINSIWILVSSVTFLLVWFMSFNTAAIAGARYLEKNRVLNVFLTAGLHFMIISAIIAFVIFTPAVLEPVLLAVSIP